MVAITPTLKLIQSAIAGSRLAVLASDGNETSVPSIGVDSSNADTVAITIQATEVICSKLGKKRIRWLDHDVFEFQGEACENVTITLSADPNGMHTGQKATLKWWDQIKRIHFTRIDRSLLPNEQSATLPASGKYRVKISEQYISAKKRSRRDYCLSIVSSGNAAETLTAIRSVE